MALPILATKVYVPPPQPGVIRRARLIERLNAGLGGKLTLISAPAGFGKTTLLSDWLAGCGRRVAWVALDAGDHKPIRFLTYVTAALQTLEAGIGGAALEALRSASPPPLEALLASLLNDIAALPDDLLLVLDDYHVLASEPIDAALTLLLDHLPPQLHLVIATREDPQLPLARLRARGQLNAVRMADLRFTVAEAAAFLNQRMGLHLAEADVAALETRTEGWIAGLQLAALALQGRTDRSEFIAAFTGSHRYVLDYLVAEALQRQPAPVRNFLLHTAILDRLSGPLCAAVSGAADGGQMLTALERANLFIIALDETRTWYRYHHLFVDALRAQLRHEQPALAPELHRRACAWYVQHNLPHDAIRHALAAEAFDEAADLIEHVWPAMDAAYQSDPWMEWARALPEPQIGARPVLCLGYGWALLNNGELEAAETWLNAAERWLDPPTDEQARMTVVDPAQWQALPAAIAGARAYGALALGNIPATRHYAQQALDLQTTPNHLSRIQAIALLGIAQWAGGDLAAADRALSDFAAVAYASGRIADAGGMAFILAEIRIARGRLREAFDAYEQSLQLMARQDAPLAYGAEDLHRGMADLHRERGELQMAVEYLAGSEELGEQGITLPNWRHRLYVSQARLMLSRGDLVGALERLEQAERSYRRTPLPDLRPIAALKARVFIRQGALEPAWAWARRQGITLDGAISYMREFAYITLARLLLAHSQSDPAAGMLHDAMRLLARLRAAAESGGRTGSLIEILILQALTEATQGPLAAAAPTLQEALALAEPEGFIQVFVDEGAALEALLQTIAAQNGAPAFVRRVLAACVGGAEPAAPTAQPLIEPLSEREHEVLRLLHSELSGPQIARELMISLNTLRTHTKNIYGKLGVNNRIAALRRAAELGLL